MKKHKKHLYVETIETKGIKIPFVNKYIFQRTTKHLADFTAGEGDWYVSVPVRPNLTLVIATDKDEK